MYIVAVSPEHTRGLSEEIKPYSHSLAAYGNFEAASSGLRKLNSAEILGFLIILEDIPDDLQAFIKYIKRCNMISTGSPVRKRLVIALQDQSDDIKFSDTSIFSELDFYRLRYERMTDSFIKRDLFGLLLRAQNHPYKKKESVSVDFAKYSSKQSLQYNPLFSPVDMLALEDVQLRDDLHHTLVEDLPLAKLQDSSSFHYLLRKHAITKLFDESSHDNQDLLNYIADQSSKEKLQLSLLYKSVQRGIVNGKID